MNKLFFVVSLALVGCASGPSEPMTPEQALVIQQMVANQQANNNATMQNMQANPLFQRQPTVQPIYTAPPRPVQCQTVRVYNTYQTRCF